MVTDMAVNESNHILAAVDSDGMFINLKIC